MTKMPVTPIEAIAIERFALHVTLPIFLEVGTSGGLLATGTLFKINDRSFVITARHIFDGVSDLTRLAYPENPIRGTLFTFGSINLIKPDQEHLDVAVIELNSSETVSRLDANWQFLSLQNVAAPSSTTDDGAFFVSGYPGSLTEKTESGWTTGKLVTAYTQRLQMTPAKADLPVYPDLDLFFDYAHDATSVIGQVIRTPELPGVSGAAIWELRPTSGIWSPEACAALLAFNRHTGTSSTFGLRTGWLWQGS